MSQPSRPSLSVLRSARDAVEMLAQNLAFQDIFAIVFHSYMLLRAFGAPESPDATSARHFALGLFTITVCVIILARGEVMRAGRLRSLLYRVGIFTPMLASYFELRHLLPALQPVLLDAQLHQIDIAILGFTPALYFVRFNELAVVEWVSFFYYSYFYLMAGMLIPALFFDEGKRLRELMVGALLVCGLGHIVYTLVPGVGPFRSIDFPEPLNGGFWWHQVQVTVANAGAQLDIFPSLHTAYPTYFSLHAFAYRKEKPFRYLWPVIVFFAANMVIATMFLRWHWFIDVVAGVVLAITARTVAVLVARREAVRDSEDDPRQPVWDSLLRP